ncbi:MAG: UDP-N-acetylmuramoyl-L-alanine--D-glutamate ligase [Gemmatimonadota bacterium]
MTGRNWAQGETAVVGLGRSGESACALLRWLGAPVYASDDKPSAELRQAEYRLRPLGVDIATGGHDLARISRAALVVASPGVPPGAPPLDAAREAGVEIISEVELALSALPGLRYIAITGTNGKTTVTALVAHLLKALGHDVEAVGNIGTPLSEMALRPVPPRWVALEISSYQLHDTPSIDPTAGILTNLAPDHLDRYPGVAAYYADKARLFRNARRTSKWIINADDRPSREMTKDVAGTISYFSAGGNFSDAFLDRQHDTLIVDDAPLRPRAQLHLLGDHNVGNALAAVLGVIRAEHGRLSLSARERIVEGLSTFRPLPHRLETVAGHGGVTWINDSKATNVSSTRVAIESMTRPVVLLLGGVHKGEPYTSLAESIRGHCRAVIAYGRSAPLIMNDLGKITGLEHVAGDFRSVLRRAAVLAHPGDCVLLSPACSSYDMFNNYEERGAAFSTFARSPGQ